MAGVAMFPEREIDAQKLARSFSRMHSDPRLESEVRSDIELIKGQYPDVLCVVPFVATDHSLMYEVGLRTGKGGILRAEAIANV